MEKEKYELTDNKERHRYEFCIGDHYPHIEYMISNDGAIYLTHTRVPGALENQGIGSELVRQTLGDIEKRELSLVPLCGFIVAYIKRHPEWKKLLREGVHIA